MTVDYDLHLPYNMQLKSSLNFCNVLEGIDYDNIDKILYSTMNFGKIEPFGMLLIGAKLREVKRRHNIKHAYYKISSPHTYAGHMGFFRSIGMPYGKEPGEAPGSRTYVPISRLSVSKIKREAKSKGVHIGDIVEGYAEDLAKILYTGDNECIGHMTFAIREIMRNVVEHSTSETIWYAGQAWHSKDLVEIAILDEGIGIEQTINSNKYYKKHNFDNLGALLMALEPGITKTFSPVRSEDDEGGWRNTGFGLYMTSNICSEIGGFVICSDKHAIWRHGDVEERIDTSFGGTAIRMRLRLSELSKVTKLRSQLVRTGETQARKNAKFAVAKASTASKLSLMRK